MLRPCSALVALLLVQPVASYGIDIDIPEIGVRLVHLPDGAKKSKLTETLDTSAISVQVGSVPLTITRLDDPVAPGTVITDAAYRKALQENFDDDLGPKAHGQATSISGQAAWTMFRAVQPVPAPVAEFTCISYVIANEHAYRLGAYVTATYGPHEQMKRPPDFDAALQAMSDITFEPVTRPPDSPSTSTTPKFPRVIGLGNLNYPDSSRARNEEGIVDVEFNIDGKGRAQNIKQIYSSSPRLDSEVETFMKSAVLRVPASWEQSGMQTSRFTAEFQFALTNPPQGCSAQSQPRIPGAEVIRVCGSRLPSR